MRNTAGIVGIVLAGGQSRRMGKNKALIEFNGKPLVRHMIEILLQTGLRDVFVSGTVEGYPCIPDARPFFGPAQAMSGIQKLIPGYRGYLFVPVDMPFLTPDFLLNLIEQNISAYFESSPLPAYLIPPFKEYTGDSVRALLEVQEAVGLKVPPDFSFCMKNINTPEEWKQAMR